MGLHRTAFSPLRCAKAAVYAGVISQGSGNFLVVGCMGLGGKLCGGFWFRVMAKASNIVVQTGSQFRLLSGCQQGAQVVGLLVAKSKRVGYFGGLYRCRIASRCGASLEFACGLRGGPKTVG